MTRRDAFGKLRIADEQIENDMNDCTQRVVSDVIQNPIQPLDLIPSARPRKKRDRKWDKEHQAEKTSYRGIPPEMIRIIGDLALSLDVPRDELVRAFLEHSLTLHLKGTLQLFSHPKAQHMTLFPDNEGKNNHSSNQFEGFRAQWLDEAFPPNNKKGLIVKQKKYRNKEKITQLWEYRLTCRLPTSLRVEIKKIADEHFVPVGELVLFFLDHSLRDYQVGNLPLDPQPKYFGNTIF